MKLYKSGLGPMIEAEGKWYLYEDSWDRLVAREDLLEYVQALVRQLEPIPPAEDMPMQNILAPIGSQEVWAAGVTYYRSRSARMEESEAAGNASIYDQVYEAARPEIFFKATAQRVVGQGAAVAIRRDSVWNVPEPEFTLLLSPGGKINGYTIGNDMSSRDIEGENPLYLPQAKVYDASAALGPCIWLTDTLVPEQILIRLSVIRSEEKVFEGETRFSQMKRSMAELIDYLYRACSFPAGCFLMTGTGIIPEADFALHAGDWIHINVEPIGTLSNYVVVI